MMDRKFSDPTTHDISIDWDDEPDGSDGGYDRNGNYINSSAMMELVDLRAKLEAERERVRVLRSALRELVSKKDGMDSAWYFADEALATTEQEDV